MCVTRGTEYEYPTAKERLFAFLFCFVRGLGHPIGRAGGTDRKAGTPQIKSSSSDLELPKSTSFDLQSTTSIDDPTTSNNFLQLSRSMVDVLPTSFTQLIDSQKILEQFALSTLLNQEFAAQIIHIFQPYYQSIHHSKL